MPNPDAYQCVWCSRTTIIVREVRDKRKELRRRGWLPVKWKLYCLHCKHMVEWK